MQAGPHKKSEPDVCLFGAYFAKLRALGIDLFHIGRGLHHTFRILAMGETECVAQFVDGFFEETLPQELGIFRKAIQFIIKAIRTDDSASAVQSRFSEDVGQDRNEQVESGNPEHFGVSSREVLFKLLKDRGRIVLAPDGIKKWARIQAGCRDVRFCVKTGFEHCAHTL
jgi:hypothetical protein